MAIRSKVGNLFYTSLPRDLANVVFTLAAPQVIFTIFVIIFIMIMIITTVIIVTAIYKK